MRDHRNAVLSALLGFAATSAVMLPPIIAHEAEKAARITAYEAAMGENATYFGRDRQARLTHLLRGMTKADKERIRHQ